MERREPDLHGTIAAIYEAGIDPEHWEEALDRIIDFAGAERALLGLTSVSRGTSGATVFRGIDPQLLARFGRDYSSQDPFSHESDALLEAGSVKHAAALFDQDQFRAAPIYRELLRPAGMVDIVAAVLAIEKGVHAYVGVYRGEDAGVFGSESVSAMAQLAPHLQRSMRVDKHLSALERRRQITEAALDQLTSSVVVVDEGGHVEYANRAAADLLSEADGIRVREGRLECDEGRALREHVDESLEHASGGREAAGGVVPVRRPSGRRSLSALVTPVARRLGRTLGFWRQDAPAALVVVSDPERADDSPEPILRELFGLTTAEARVAWALARGLSTDEYAAERNISIATARWQIKQVFSKTGTHRQAELVSLVLRSLGPFRP